MRVVATDESSSLNDLDSPVKLGYLSRAEGFKPALAELLVMSVRYTNELERMLFVLQLLLQVAGMPHRFTEDKEGIYFRNRDWRMFAMRGDGSPVRELVGRLIQNGLVPQDVRREVERYDHGLRELADRYMHEARDPRDLFEMSRRLIRELSERGMTGHFGGEFEHWLMRSLEVYMDPESRREWEKRVEREPGFFRRMFTKG